MQQFYFINVQTMVMLASFYDQTFKRQVWY